MAKPNRKQQPVTNENEGEILNEAPEAPDEAGLDTKASEGPVVIPATEAPVMSAEELIAQYGNKSNAIRALNSEGKTRSEIAKLLGIRYQHVNNVLNQVLKRPIKAEREARKNVIVLEGDLPVAQGIDAVVKS